MSGDRLRAARGVAPLLVVGAVVVAVAIGAAQGVRLPNVHNGVLALALAFVGAYVLYQRPGHREGVLFLVTGLVHAVMFLGRQVGQTPGGEAWWGWLGVWPLALALGLTTFCVICFPDGCLPSPGWRAVAAVIVALCVTCAGLSAVWPVEYASAGVVTAHPLNAAAPTAVATVWGALAHPVYAGLQLLWIVAVAQRWRAARAAVRGQLARLMVTAATSLLVLLAGLAVAGTPTPGLLTTSLVPVVAGWAILHGQQATAYSALSWQSRVPAPAGDLPLGLARAAAEALDAAQATLWIGADDLCSLAVWPQVAAVPDTTVTALSAAPDRHSRIVTGRASVVGALSVVRAERLSRAESLLLDHLAAQASLVLEHVGATTVTGGAPSARTSGLTGREQDVLALLAAGLSNSAIGQELHLSVKTVEPIVSTIFAKLGLPQDAGRNRRVLAALAYLPDRGD